METKTYRVVLIERQTGRIINPDNLELITLAESEVIPTQIKLSTAKTLYLLKEYR